MQGWVIVIIAIAYVSLLFAIASVGDRHAGSRRIARLRPLIYALSLAIYCTSWTFFGSVGLASERGLEFLAIYIGPALVFLFGFPLLRRMIRLAKAEKITSVADFLAARYGKSFAVASIATIIATLGAVPYIALQLKAISGSVSLMVEHYSGVTPHLDFFVGDVSLAVTLLLAMFAVLFGTRHADATEHQDGLVLAVAVESIVKLAAFIAVGLAVTFFFLGGIGPFIETTAASEKVMEAVNYQTSLPTWIVVTALSGFAIILLPRQFYVTIVETRSEGELKTATWLFPLYLVLINILVLPVAFAGLTMVGTRTSADLYVLSVPLFSGHDTLAMIAFIGGLSAATAMVIVESVALSIMISNDLVIPTFARGILHPTERRRRDLSTVILNIRRAAIFIILFAAFLYYREATSNTRLSSIGLMSFAAIAQFAPAFFGGLVWRRANGRGAILGMIAGIAVWTYTLLIPSLAPPGTDFVTHGPFGIAALRPQSLFGTVGEPLNHGVLWSLAINTLFFILGSLSRASEPLERIQAALFVPRDTSPMPNLRRMRTGVTARELLDTIARYLGVERAERAFQAFERQSGVKIVGSEPANTALIRHAEQLLTSAVGSSSARLVLSLLFQRNDSSARDTYRLLDDASEALQQNRDMLQIALDQMEQGITVLDRDFRLSNWNRRFADFLDLPDDFGQVGVPLTQVIERLVQRGDLAPGSESVILNNLSNYGTSWQVELKTSGRILELRSNPMPDGGLVATYADITARVRADRALKEANESLEQRVASRTVELTRVNAELAQAQMLAEEANLGKTRFLAAVGHDILQPLNAARLYCASLIERTRRGPEAEAAANIDSSLDSVEAILGAVLDISRLDAGAMKPQSSVFSLGSLLRQIGTDFQPLAQEKGLRLRIVASSLNVMTDQNLLRRLIQNLVSNAIKYTRSGSVLIGVRRRGELAEIQVIDTGIGIPGDKLNSVFTEFMRLDEGAREAQGLGLGLSIVDRIARVLRLELRLGSHGHGTIFSVVLPVTRERAAVESSQRRSERGGAFAADGMTIYCVDNDSRILEGMQTLLTGWGCNVVAMMGSGDMQRIGADMPTPDLIFADYHLDGETGFDVIARLRARFGDVPAALITADRSDEVRMRGDQSDIPVLSKPIKPAALRSMIARWQRAPTPAQ
ncbi:MAG: hybrid sensor histidine kinase/response regulator [Mesorhizobium sp.]